MSQPPCQRIFISYSHRGNGPQWKAALLRSLEVFERQHLLDVWEDGKIRVSSYWEDDIERAIDEAQCAVVLLTREALESEFILTKELPRLRERQQREKLPVFPVICEPCEWREHDWLQATQAPNASKPLSDLSSEAQEQVFRQLATAIAEEISRSALSSLSQGDESGTTAEPGPAVRVYLDKFPLTRGPGLREERLIGREQELALLDLAFASSSIVPHRVPPSGGQESRRNAAFRTAIVSLVAWGGVGKTMLVKHWFQRLQREDWLGARRVYAWSFYSQGTREDRQASEDLFLAHALDWFGVQCEATLSPWDKGRLLAEAIDRERTLLILDGIEPLQYPPGPMGGQLRAPGVQSLLKQIARKTSSDRTAPGNSLVLVTTREPLTDLAEFQRRAGSPWGSVLRVDLGNLTDEAGAALLHHAGANRAGAAAIKPDDKELLAASLEVDGHALTLNLLGCFLARAQGGDIRRRDVVKFDEADRTEQGGTTFKMLAAFEAWFAESGEFAARQLAVLRILGLFDRPADADCIGALRRPPIIVGLTDPLFTTRFDASTGKVEAQPLVDEDWNTATSFLADFGLIVIQTGPLDNKRHLDCHPLIREYFASTLKKLNQSGWSESNTRLAEYFEQLPIKQCPDSLREIQVLFQSIAHRVYGENPSAAIDTLMSRVSGNNFIATTKFGLFAEVWSACRVILNGGTSEMDSQKQAFVQQQLGYSARSLGFMDEAVVAFKNGLKAQKQVGEPGRSSIVAALLAVTQLYCGNLAEGEANALEAVRFARHAAANDKIMYALSGLGKIELYLGKLNEAEEHLREAIEFIGDPLNRENVGNCTNIWFRLSELLLSKKDYSGALEVANDALAYERKNEAGPMFRALLQTNKAYSLLRIGTAEREELMDLVMEAISNFRKGSFVHESVRGFLLAAEAFQFLDKASDGIPHLDEAWDIASRGPMRLHLADIHLHRARLFFCEKVYPWESPQADLAAAEKLINECGYHRRDEELADAKRAILGES